MAASTLLLSAVLACAPHVHPDTALRIIHHESGGNPYAIGINGPWMLSRQPTSKAQAIATALVHFEKIFPGFMKSGRIVDLLEPN